MSNYIFVYGTLKRGFGNSELLKDSIFISEAETINKYALYADGIPFVIKHQNETQIKGEVYNVNSNTLLNLDILEGHPSVYKRELVDVSLSRYNYNIKAWLYFYPIPTGYKIKDGNFKKTYMAERFDFRP